MQKPSIDVSPEKERLFQEMEAELARYNEEISRCKKLGQPRPPKPHFDQELFLEMRAWQGRRLSRKVQEEVVPAMRRLYQKPEQKDPE